MDAPANRVPTLASRRTTRRAAPRAGNRTMPDILLSDSERSGFRLLWETAATGRLRLPEEMLQDSTVPIIEGDNQ
jgi:hypothetical protein